MRFLLLTILTLGVYPVVRVALGLCRLVGEMGRRTSPKTQPRSVPELEQPPTVGTDERLMRQEVKAKVRALRHSHSKTIRADLRRMRASGINQVQVLTAQDERVCAHCRALEGKTFSIKDAQTRNLLSGTHCDEGYCRCVYLAVIPSVSQ